METLRFYVNFWTAVIVTMLHALIGWFGRPIWYFAQFWSKNQIPISGPDSREIYFAKDWSQLEYPII